MINPQSRSFTIEAKLPGQEGYKPNMIAVVKILDYEKKDAMVAEVNHIQKSGDANTSMWRRKKMEEILPGANRLPLGKFTEALLRSLPD